MKKIIILLIAFSYFTFYGQNEGDIKKSVPEITKIYKHLHQNPELSYLESKTAKLLAEKMRSYGFEVTEQVGGTGVVAVLKNGKGPKVLIRTDMDALPVLEKTNVPYASKIMQVDIEGVERPVMHACGHDIHMSVWLGTAKYLAEHKKEWKGSLLMIAQPAEERGGGAKAMLEDGLYSKFFVPDFGLALHINSSLPAGKIAYCPGYAMANVDMAQIKIIGKGGHGAYPQKTIDPIVMASQLVVELQSIVAREIAPVDPGVVTVGSFHGGTKGNIIPTEVNLELTIRSYKDDVREHLISAIERKTKAVAASFGVDKKNYPVFKLKDTYTPALYNNPELTENVVSKMKEGLGADNIIKVDPVMGGEDFARYGKTQDNVPIFMFNLGVVNIDRYNTFKKEGKQLPSIHSDLMIPDPEASIETGIKAMVIAVKSLKK
ncbi:amidohydrolase [Lutibacter sp.]